MPISVASIAAISAVPRMYPPSTRHASRPARSTRPRRSSGKRQDRPTPQQPPVAKDEVQERDHQHDPGQHGDARARPGDEVRRRLRPGGAQRLVEVPVERHVERVALEPVGEVVQAGPQGSDELVVLLHDGCGHDRDQRGDQEETDHEREGRRRPPQPGSLQPVGERRQRRCDRDGDDGREHDHVHVPEQGDDRRQRRRAHQQAPRPPGDALQALRHLGNPGRPTPGHAGSLGVGLPRWTGSRSTSCSWSRRSCSGWSCSSG